MSLISGVHILIAYFAAEIMPMEVDRNVTEVLRRAEEVLRAAYAGLEMMKSSKGNTRDLGLRNVLTFSRSVTFVIQNLRGKAPNFEEWYLPHQEFLKSDPVFNYFKDARNILEKQGKLELGVHAELKKFDSDIMRKLEIGKPPGAGAFFIGDPSGGSGWEVKLPNGEILKYYIDLPEEVGTVSQFFLGEYAEKYDPHLNKSTYELAEYVLEKLSSILDDARKYFTKADGAGKVNGVRLPPYLRVIK